MLTIPLRARLALCRFASPLASPGPQCSSVHAGLPAMLEKTRAWVRENAAETRQVLTAYAELLQGTRPGRSIIRDLGALEKYGVSAGTLAVVTRPEA